MFVKNTSCLKVGFNLQDACKRACRTRQSLRGEAHEANVIVIQISAFAWLQHYRAGTDGQTGRNSSEARILFDLKSVRLKL
jgi:hypothetical protein